MRNQSNPLDLQWKAWDLAMRNQSNPLDLQWKAWGLAMRNHLNPLDLHWKTWGLAMRNHLNPLDLHWKTLDFGMGNPLNPLELHWASWDFVWESSWIHWICIENHEILHEKPIQTIRFRMEIMRFGIQDGFHNIWAAISWSNWDWTYISHQPWVLSWLHW